MALTKIRLYGHLGKKFGREWELDVSSPGEAVRALRVLCRGFESAVLRHKPGYAVFVGKDNIGEDLLGAPCGKEVIKIVPLVAGAKGIFDFVLIIAAVALFFFSGPLGTFVSQVTGASIASSTAFVTQLAVTLAVVGISSMLAPTPPKPGQDKKSFSFNGAQNTIPQGASVPLGYGKLIVGSAVLSAGVYVEQIGDTAAAPVTGIPVSGNVAFDANAYPPSVDYPG